MLNNFRNNYNDKKKNAKNSRQNHHHVATLTAHVEEWVAKLYMVKFHKLIMIFTDTSVM